MARWSHLHLAFTDLDAAITFFDTVLGARVTRTAHGAEAHMGEVVIALHADWGQGASALTLALESLDCAADLARWRARGAVVRSEAEVREGSIHGSIHGPEGLVVEAEQRTGESAPAGLRDAVARLLMADDAARDVLEVVASAGPELWVCAGFIRNRVWSHVALRPCPPDADIDVIHVRPDPHKHLDLALEAALREVRGELVWSVKSQVRMAAKSGAVVRTMDQALLRFPETATAVAARLRNGGVEVAAPLGLTDLFAGIVAPTPSFYKRGHVVHQRARYKGWLTTWPHLRLRGVDGLNGTDGS